MKKLLRSPAVNAVCISLFTAFYSLVCLAIAKNGLFEAGSNGRSLFWSAWSKLLSVGHQRYIVYGMIALTALVVMLLMTRKRSYDEYHTAILTNCLVVAAVLILIAIAVFYLLILFDPSGFLEKLTLFIITHWVTVVMANLVYVLMYRRR